MTPRLTRLDSTKGQGSLNESVGEESDFGLEEIRRPTWKVGGVPRRRLVKRENTPEQTETLVV